jgi:hypothetical protein
MHIPRRRVCVLFVPSMWPIGYGSPSNMMAENRRMQNYSVAPFFLFIQFYLLFMHAAAAAASSISYTENVN